MCSTRPISVDTARARVAPTTSSSGSDPSAVSGRSPGSGRGRRLRVRDDRVGRQHAAGTTGLLNAFKYGLDGNGDPTLQPRRNVDGRVRFQLGLTGDLVEQHANPDRPWCGSSGHRTARATTPSSARTTRSPSTAHSTCVGLAPIGQSAKFSVPVISGHRVILGTRDGKIKSFGSPITAPLTAPPLNFPDTTIGQSTVRTVTLTANFELDCHLAQLQQPTVHRGLAVAHTPGSPHRGPDHHGADDVHADVLGAHVGEPHRQHVGRTGHRSERDRSVQRRPAGVHALALSLGGAVVGGGSVTGSMTLRNAGSLPLTINSATVRARRSRSAASPRPAPPSRPAERSPPPPPSRRRRRGVFTDVIELSHDRGRHRGTGLGHRHDRSTHGVQRDDDRLRQRHGRRHPLAQLHRQQQRRCAAGHQSPSRRPEGCSPRRRGSPRARRSPRGQRHGSRPLRTSRSWSSFGLWDITGTDGPGTTFVTFSGTGFQAAPPTAPSGGGWQLNGSASMNGRTSS